MSTDPLRPTLPSGLWFAGAVALGTWLAECLSWYRFVGASDAPKAAWIGAVAVLAVLLSVAVDHRRFVAVCLSGIMLGGVCGTLYWSDWRVQVREATAPGTGRWLGRVTEDVRASAFGKKSVVAVIFGSGSVLTDVSWPREDPDRPFGSEVSFFGRLRPAGPDGAGRRLHRQGVVGSVSARVVRSLGFPRTVRGGIAAWRDRETARLTSIPPPAGALLAGVLLGDTRALSHEPASDDFRTCGLTHLVAISGGHLVVVAAILGAILQWLGSGRLTTACAVQGMLGAYVIATGVQPSAVRAWLMTAVMALAALSGRRGDGLSALSIAVVGALTLWPPTLFDLGFRLSVVAVLGLLLFAPLATRWVACALPRRAEVLAAPLAMTLVAQAVTTPITSPAFGMTSLVAPLANLVAGPMISCVLIIGLSGLCAAQFSSAAGMFALTMAGSVANGVVEVAQWFAGAPFAAVPTGDRGAGVLAAVLFLGCAVLWAVWPRADVARARALVGSAVALCGLVLLVSAPPSDEMIRVLDVGQGDAIVVRGREGTLLVDTGASPGALRKALARARVRTITGVVLTHFHDDHTGGL